MEQRDDSLEQTLENWRHGRASLDQIRKLAGELGDRPIAAGIPVLVKLLDHEDTIVRYHAAMSLGFDLKHKPATDRLLTMLADDPDADVRDVAAGALKILWQNTKDRRVLSALAEAALNDPDEDVRSSAFEALIIVHGVSKEEHLRMLTGGKLTVDPVRVKAILTQTSA
jgi:HEAT repeat protein